MVWGTAVEVFRIDWLLCLHCNWFSLISWAAITSTTTAVEYANTIWAQHNWESQMHMKFLNHLLSFDPMKLNLKNLTYEHTLLSLSITPHVLFDRFDSFRTNAHSREGSTGRKHAGWEDASRLLTGAVRVWWGHRRVHFKVDKLRAGGCRTARRRVETTPPQLPTLTELHYSSNHTVPWRISCKSALRA